MTEQLNQTNQKKAASLPQNQSKKSSQNRRKRNRSEFSTNKNHARTNFCPKKKEEFDPYEVSLAITVFNDKIISISDVSWSDTSNNWYMKRAMNGASGTKGVVTQVTEAGTLDQIDTISGATCSSKALIEACQTALDSAKR